MDVAIIDYQMGNLRSVLRAWQAVGANSRIISNPSEIKDTDILVFPGQGAITDAIELLKKNSFDKVIKDWIAQDKPFFGICLGLQALFEYSEEGNCECLGVFKGSVKKMNFPHEYKVPHMGWNNIDFKKNETLLKDIDSEDQFYFVHSYYVDTNDNDIIFGKTAYGQIEFTSAIQKGNVFACQFHPEKSQSKGLQLYSNFLQFIKQNYGK